MATVMLTVVKYTLHTRGNLAPVPLCFTGVALSHV